MFKKDPNAPPKGYKKFEERLTKLRDAYQTAEDDRIDDLLADAEALLRSSEPLCEYFLLHAERDLFKFAFLVLESAIEDYADAGFLQALKAAQQRFPEFDLAQCMDDAAYEIARRDYEAATQKDPKTDARKVLDSSSSGPRTGIRTRSTSWR